MSQSVPAWVVEFDSIKSSLVYMGMKRVIHRAHMKQLLGRDIWDGTGIVHRWIQENYADSMLIGLRRILDKDKRTCSLIKLLQKVQKNHALFTFEGYLQLWSNAQPRVDDRYARALYITFSSNGRTLDKRRIEEDIKILLAGCKSVLDHINDVVAHQRRETYTTAAVTEITWDEFDTIFTDVAALFNKYYALVKPGVHVDFEPVLPAGFEQAFARMFPPGDG